MQRQNDKYSSNELAALILSSVQEEDLYQYENSNNKKVNLLVDMVNQKDEDSLSFWLTQKSFINHSLNKIIQSYDYDDIKNPSEDLKSKVKEFFNNHLNELEKKQNIAAFKTIDFADTDIKEIRDLNKLDNIDLIVKKINTILSNPNSEQGKFTLETLKPLANAKKRRFRELGRNNFEPRFVNGMKNSSNEDPYSINELYNNMAALKLGERTQIFISNPDNPHVTAIDVERNDKGELVIFGFDTTSDAAFQLIMDKLHDKLVEKNEQNFKLTACNGRIQNDGYNCSLMSLAVMAELSKYDHVLQYLPEQFYEAGDKNEESKLQDAYKFNEFGEANNYHKKTYEFKNSQKITWYNTSDLPMRLIFMSQSYDTFMTRFLEKRNEDNQKFGNFDTVDPEELIKKHKERVGFKLPKRKLDDFGNPDKQARFESDQTKEFAQRREKKHDKLEKATGDILLEIAASKLEAEKSGTYSRVKNISKGFAASLYGIVKIIVATPLMTISPLFAIQRIKEGISDLKNGANLMQESKPKFDLSFFKSKSGDKPVENDVNANKSTFKH